MSAAIAEFMDSDVRVSDETVKGCRELGLECSSKLVYKSKAGKDVIQSVDLCYVLCHIRLKPFGTTTPSFFRHFRMPC